MKFRIFNREFSIESKGGAWNFIPILLVIGAVVGFVATMALCPVHAGLF